MKILAPVYDCIFIEFTLEKPQAHISIFKEVMIQASKSPGDFKLHVNLLGIDYPDRFKNANGKEMWRLVWSIISEN